MVIDMTSILSILYLLFVYAGSIALSGEFIDFIWPTFIYNINCTGLEDSIWQCSHSILADQGFQCSDNQDSSVVCQGIHNIIPDFNDLFIHCT